MKSKDISRNTEKLLNIIADNQKFSSKRDKLTALIEKYSDGSSQELSEEELCFAAAAKMPTVPKYKTLNDE